MNVGIIGLLVFIALVLASIDNKLGKIGKILEQFNKEKTGSNELQSAQGKSRRRYHHFEDTMV